MVRKIEMFVILGVRNIESSLYKCSGIVLGLLHNNLANLTKYHFADGFENIAFRDSEKLLSEVNLLYYNYVKSS